MPTKNATRGRLADLERERLVAEEQQMLRLADMERERLATEEQQTCRLADLERERISAEREAADLELRAELAAIEADANIT